MTAATPMLSIVIPMYHESGGLEALFSRLFPTLEQITPDFEVVCVDDGSGDDTYRKLSEWHRQEPRIRAIKFSRNFGKEAALAAGLDAARGQAVIPLDADLQDPPELIGEMVALWRQGYKVVLATRKSRPGDGWLKRTTARGFYRIINKLSKVKLPENTGDFRLLDRQVVDVICRLEERTRFLKGLFAWAGFKTTTIYYERPERAIGETQWNYWKLWAYALDGIFAFSTIPLRIWTYAGALISSVSFLYALYLILRTLLFGVTTPGYASLMAAILFIGGIQLISLGIIGEYVGRIYRETKHRPLYVIESSTGV